MPVTVRVVPYRYLLAPFDSAQLNICTQVMNVMVFTQDLMDNNLLMQASLAVVAGASSAWLAYIGGPNRKMHATAAVLMLGMLPWTVLIIFPVNDELRSKKKLSDTEVPTLSDHMPMS